MEKEFSTSGLSDYLEANIEQIERVRSEVSEIQLGFNSAYVEWRAKHDAGLAKLTLELIENLERAGPQLSAAVLERQVNERELIEKRRKELRSIQIPSLQKQADGDLAKAQKLTDELRGLNPQLNQQEEKLKRSIAEGQAELQKLQDELRQQSRGLGFILHFSRIGELDRKRQRQIGRLEELQKNLHDVRAAWDKFTAQASDEHAQLKMKYQEDIARLAQLQAELNYLDEPASREKLSFQRAVRNTLDELKTPAASPDPEIQSGLAQMVENNIQTDDYLQGLEAVGGLIGLLGGVQEGMRRFNESVTSLHSQETMHSQYLSKLKIRVREEVLAFNQQWGELLKRTQDEKTAAAHPHEFYSSVQPYIEKGLSNDRLQEVFESLGRSLEVATKAWK